MKFIKWKSLIVTCIVCVLPIILGLALWNDLPDKIAIHFNFYNQPDNFTSKGFSVFGLPVMMMFLQIVCCIINDIDAKKHGDCKNFEAPAKWLIPFMAVVLQTVILCYALGWNIDIRKVVAVILGVVFLVIGICLSKCDYVKNHDVDTEKARKINKFIGYETVIMGILILLTIFLPPVATIIWLILLLPYTALGIIYGIKVAKND